MNPHEPYAKVRDPQSERTGWEIKAIFAVVAIVLLGSVIWRAATHTRPGPDTKGYRVTAVVAPPAPPAPHP
jgi:hypothetical protein